MNVIKTVRKLLLENVTLTKGSQRVMNDKNLVKNLADAVRDDVRFKPASFPPGFNKTIQKLSDEQVAQWFLKSIDDIEKEGYEGTIYSRDGVNSDWIVRKYITGSHNWEDLTGVMNMNLRDWYALRNRNLLDQNHMDIKKFNGVRDLGKYLITHYEHILTDIRNLTVLAAIRKQSKTAKLVDNDDYKIYTVFNWAGARTLGYGTQWCTANSTSDTNYNRYANGGMLFQLYPKKPEYVDKVSRFTGKQVKGDEKYQFDTPSNSFKDIADEQANPNIIRERFPYIYDDVVKALTQNKEKLQTSINDMADDPALDTKEQRTKRYDIDDEINKLSMFIGTFFTDKKRPATAIGQDQQPPEQNQQPPEQNQMESIRKLYDSIMDDDDDNDDDDEYVDRNVLAHMFSQIPELYPVDKNIPTTDVLAYTFSQMPEPYSVHRNRPTVLDLKTAKKIARLPRGKSTTVGDTTRHTAGPYYSGEIMPIDPYYPEDRYKLPPTFDIDKSKGPPEYFLRQITPKKGTINMEKVDKDVAAMLKSLRKYDMLAESVSPVLRKKEEYEIDEAWDDDDEPEKVNVGDHIYYTSTTDRKNYTGKVYKLANKDGYMMAQVMWDNNNMPPRAEESDNGWYNTHWMRTDAMINQSKERMKRDDEARKKAYAAGKVHEAEECPTCHCDPCECDEEQLNEISDQLANKAYNTRLVQYKKAKGDADLAQNRAQGRYPEGERNKQDAAAKKLNKNANLNISRDFNRQQKTQQKNVKYGEVAPDKAEWDRLEARSRAVTMRQPLGERSIEESADQEVLDWMRRFNKLGNMKGYGR